MPDQPFDFASMLQPQQADTPSVPDWLGGLGTQQPQDQPTSFSTTATALQPLSSGAEPPQAPTELQNRLSTLGQKIGDILDPNSEWNRRVQELQKPLMKSIEQRTQEKMDQARGVTKTSIPFQGPLQPGQTAPETTPQQHRNWLKTILSYVGEMGLAQKQGANYVPLQERMAQQAEKEYQAEAVPAAAELRYHSEDMRNALTNFNTDLRTQQLLMGEQDRNAVARSRTQAYQLLAEQREKLTQAQAQMYQIRAEYEPQKVIAELQQKRAQAGLETAQAGKIGAEVQQGLSPQERQIRQVMSDEGVSYEKAMDRVNRSKALGTESFSMKEEPGTGMQYLFGNRGDVRNVPGAGNAVPGRPPQTPPNSTIMNDPTLQPEPMARYGKPDAIQGRQAESAINAYTVGERILSKIESFPDSELGNLAGAIKMVGSHFETADPRYTGLVGDLNSYSAFNAGVHNFRNRAFMEEVEQHGGNLMANKAALKAYINSFQNADIGIMRNNRWVRNQLLRNPDFNYNDHKEIFFSQSKRNEEIDRPNAATGGRQLTPDEAIKKLRGGK